MSKKRTHSVGKGSFSQTRSKRIKMTAPANVVSTPAATKAMSMKSKTSRRKSMSGSIRKRVTRLERDLLLDVDRKYELWIDQSTVTITNAAPHLLLLNGMAIGTTQHERLGSFMNMGKGHISMKVQWIHSTDTSPAVNKNYRILVVLQKDTGGTILNVANLFRSATPQVHEMFDFKFKPVFQNNTILYDKIYEAKVPQIAYDAVKPVISANTETIINFGWDAKNYRSKWTGNGLTIADLKMGSIYLVVLTNSTVSGRLHLTYDAVQYMSEKKAY